MTEIAARAKNIQLQVLKVQHRGDLAEAFAAARNAEAQALNIFASPFLSSLSGEIIRVSAAQRLPAIYQWKEHFESGGLVSYGPSLVQLWRQAGTIAAKLLKGAKPADMPVEQPTKFELVVNTRTAKAIGINLSPSLLVPRMRWLTRPRANVGSGQHEAAVPAAPTNVRSWGRTDSTRTCRHGRF